MTEQLLQQTMVAALRKLYPEFVLNLSLNGISLDGLTPAHKSKIIAQCKREGMVPGIQDISIYLDKGVVLNLELKKPGKGKQSPDQLAVEQQLHKLGHTYYLCDNIDLAFKLVADHTELPYRHECFSQLANSLPSTLTEQFLYFPVGTTREQVLAAVEPYYHLEY